MRTTQYTRQIMFKTLSTEYLHVVAETDKLIGGDANFSHLQGCVYDLTLLLLVNLVLWLLSLLLGKIFTPELFWAAWPSVLTGTILARSPLREISTKQYLILAVVSFWGARLTLSTLARWRGVQREEWRYAQLRDLFGPRLFPLVSLLVVFLGQGAIVFTASLPLYAALRNRISLLDEVDLLGLVIMLAGIVLETSADEQMDLHRAQQKAVLGVLDKGVWAYSRHPNYFGEWLFWFGLWVLSGFDRVGALGPVTVFVLLVLVSVPLMEDYQMERRGEEYLAYKQRVPSAFIPLPSFLTRWKQHEAPPPPQARKEE